MRERENDNGRQLVGLHRHQIETAYLAKKRLEKRTGVSLAGSMIAEQAEGKTLEAMMVVVTAPGT
jgi:hypothetical protein